MYVNPDPNDACRREKEQILICKTWMAMEGIQIPELYRHITRRMVC